ncbi:MAG: CsbD family protein [Acidobacteria bacterium]|nr:CsbD family protein [Acidobacteriota bacterium]MBV9146630.1 CsbD family protein [Acidobacteriota bacterium]MBV9435636.1 CsbD family protein [Acidobacteriota bacterium]
MDKDRIKGKMDEVAGRAKRQVGEWTGDVETQGEGAAEEIKGTVQNAWGKVKDGARNLGKEHDDANRDIETDRKRDVA